MTKVVVRRSLLSETSRYYPNDDLDGPYYEVWQDADTESIDFIDPADASRNRRLLVCLTGYPPGCDSIEDVIYRHMREPWFGRPWAPDGP